jgi:chemotaxis protein methyltransferase CheR
MFEFLKKETAIEKHLEEKFNDVERVAKYFKEETGVTFESQLSILKNKVIIFCRKRGIFSFEELLEKVPKNSHLKQELIDYLTTNETFFYREFSQVQKLIELVKKSLGKVDILCAPCATGEEPYSIAIALMESGVKREEFSIVAIDINEEALKKAKDGVYKQRSVRNLSKEILDRYFTSKDDLFKLKDEIKANVKFKRYNIFDKNISSLGKFDFVFSRNMLIYFDKETKIKAKKILQDLRKTDTYDIFLGHADFFE